jgi:hypothetical protein
MVAALEPRDYVGWLAPCPWWRRLGDLRSSAARAQFLRPVIMRFAHDEFMDELLSVLSYEPWRLPEWQAEFETWEQPMQTPTVGDRPALTEPRSSLCARIYRQGHQPPASTGNGDEEETPRRALKLYQPIHKRYYLVSASLVCRRPGLPNRRVDSGRRERVSFVLRRIEAPLDAQSQPSPDPTTWQEYAFLPEHPTAPWQAVETGRVDTLFPGEERLPMLPSVFQGSEGQRHMFSGLVPVGRREAYLAAGVGPVAGDDTTGGAAGAKTRPDPRTLLFQLQVTGPWNQLLGQAMDEYDRSTGFGGTAPSKIETDYRNDDDLTPPSQPLGTAGLRDQMQTTSWYILLDFARFLRQHVPRVWTVLTGALPRAALDDDTEEPLVARLHQMTLVSSLRSELATNSRESVPQTVWAALHRFAQSESNGVMALETQLEAAVDPFDRSAPSNDWPGFLFPLADPREHGPFPFVVDGTNLSGSSGGRIAAQDRFTNSLEELATLVQAALPPDDPRPPPELSIPAEPASPAGGTDVWFVARCVYERPQCAWRAPTVVSAPTEPFRMASFFDPDAPARPARIPMPADVSVAGLRKFNKGATLMISDMLCGKLKRIRKLTLGDLVLSVLPWPFHKDLPNPTVSPGDCQKPNGDAFGMFCSLSIPIVTIAALILLIIIVQLFDTFFRWVPLLFTCFPIFGKKK